MGVQSPPDEITPSMVSAGLDALTDPEWATPDASIWFDTFRRSGSNELSRVVVAIYEAMRASRARCGGDFVR